MGKIKFLSFLILVISAVIFLNDVRQQNRLLDTEGPVIEIDGELLEVSIYDPEETYLTGVTATDKRDGDVTDSLVVESISEFTEENTRIVNYAAFDSSNHVSKSFRRIRYTDYTPIHMELTQPLRFAITTSDEDFLAGMVATDCLDGDISEKIMLSSDSSVTVSRAGEYPVTIQVTNSAGDTFSLPVTITIYEQAAENAAPKLSLTDYLVYVSEGERLSAYDYLESVTVKNISYEPVSGQGTYLVDTTDMDSEELADFRKRDPAISYDYIEIEDNVDYSRPGAYEIKYMMRDEDGNLGSVYLIVIVEEA